MNLIQLIIDKFKQTKKMENQNEQLDNAPGSIGVEGVEGNNENASTKIADKLKDVIDAIKVQNATGNLDGTIQHLEVGLTFYKAVMGI